MERQLESIIRDKKSEIETLLKLTESNRDHPINQIFYQSCTPKSNFSNSLKKNSLAVIAEIKRKSPSRGEFATIANPIDLALEYCKGGASAISVSTDTKYFGGSLEDLKSVASALTLQRPQIAILRRDFILHPIQLAETAYAGAHAVVLIAHILKKELKLFIHEARCLGLEALVEIHDLVDLECAIAAEAPIIGVSHRNLDTFEVDMNRTRTLKPLLPAQAILVAESGIHLPLQAKEMKELGYNAVMVGEALVRSSNPAKLIEDIIKVSDS